MNMNRLLGGASSFVHLAGIGRGKRAEDEDRDDKTSKRSKAAEGDDEDDEKEDKTSKRSRAAEDDDDGDDKTSKRSKAAEGDDEDDEKEDKTSKRSRAAEDDDAPDQYPEDDDTKGKRGKRSRAAEGDDEDEDDDKDEMSGRSAAANARRRERARCAAIFAAPAAAHNVALAASLAFETTMTRCEAIAVLKGQVGRGGAAGNDGRAARNANLGPGGEAKPSTKQAIGASWDRAITSVGVKPRDK